MKAWVHKTFDALAAVMWLLFVLFVLLLNTVIVPFLLIAFILGRLSRVGR